VALKIHMASPVAGHILGHSLGLSAHRHLFALSCMIDHEAKPQSLFRDFVDRVIDGGSAVNMD
jgi:hypothetical protein